ncbi:MAG TPA: hypothetical protein ENK44_04420 [Caldithrix abyssi]|uniref:Uncharacterized protein n=1 Tax=Caldithrix abyssi TaxID=187145 RepID=A0A7V4TZ77_CALAY|nr:hypothetical protein [Caldithrix abyssi]
MMSDQTDTIPAVDAYSNSDPADSSMLIRYIYADGLHNTEVILYKVIGTGHGAPGTKGNIHGYSNGISFVRTMISKWYER